MVPRYVPYIAPDANGTIYATCFYSRVRWRVQAYGWPYGEERWGAFVPVNVRPI